MRNYTEKIASKQMNEVQGASLQALIATSGCIQQTCLNLPQTNFLDYGSLGRLIQYCTDRGLFRIPKQIHAQLILSSVTLGNYLASKLITFYSKSNQLRQARKVFDQIPHRNTFTWNAMLIGYSILGMHANSLKLFSSFVRDDFENARPDGVTMTCVLKTLSSLVHDLRLARELHCYILRRGFGSEIIVTNALITHYSRCDGIDFARTLFDKMPERDVVSWNSMLAAYSQSGYYPDCKKLYRKMLDVYGFRPNEVTMISILQACAQSGDLVLGMDVHRFVIENEIKVDLFLFNAIVALYAKCGSLDYAQELFEEMSVKDEATYNCIITGYMHHGFVEKAMDVFLEMKRPGLSTWNAVISGMVQNNRHEGMPELVHKMQASGLKPNDVTLTSILPSISHISNLKVAKEIHGFAVRYMYDSNVYMATAIVDAYAKSGFLDGAQRIFCQTKYRSVIAWTSIIAAYAAHGDAKKAISLFDEMLNFGIQPDPVTFTSLLAACAHSGEMDEAWKIFNAMLPQYGVEPLVEHYACIVGVLSRAGRISEAVEFISTMPMEPNAKVWGAVLNGASVARNVEIGRYACDHLFKIEPECAWNYIVMANLYSQAGRWEEAEVVRRKMNKIKLEKNAGCSWIQTTSGLQSFIAKDESNERTEEIYQMLESLLKSMRKEGYVLKYEFNEESVSS